MPPTPEQFRHVGFTADAVNYPLSLAGQAIIAEHNGVTVESLPDAFRYSSGPGMHRWIEALGAAKVKRHPSGRWLLPKELGLARPFMHLLQQAPVAQDCPPHQREAVVLSLFVSEAEGRRSVRTQ